MIVAFGSNNSWRGKLRMSDMHWGFRNAYLTSSRRIDRNRHALGPTPPYTVCKNVFRIDSVFGVDHVLLAFELGLCEELGRCTTAETEPVAISHAYRYPYAVGDFSYEQDDAYDGSLSETEEIIQRFADKYRCEAPPLRHRCVIPEIIHEPEGGDPSWREVEVGSSELRHTIRISKSEVIQHGLVWKREYFCREDVFKLLRPHLEWPYFWWTFLDVK